MLPQSPHTCHSQGPTPGPGPLACPPLFLQNPHTCQGQGPTSDPGPPFFSFFFSFLPDRTRINAKVYWSHSIIMQTRPSWLDLFGIHNNFKSVFPTPHRVSMSRWHIPESNPSNLFVQSSSLVNPHRSQGPRPLFQPVISRNKTG